MKLLLLSICRSKNYIIIFPRNNALYAPILNVPSLRFQYQLKIKQIPRFTQSDRINAHVTQSC